VPIAVRVVVVSRGDGAPSLGMVVAFRWSHVDEYRTEGEDRDSGARGAGGAGCGGGDSEGGMSIFLRLASMCTPRPLIGF
jgi:hypothetical protein